MSGNSLAACESTPVLGRSPEALSNGGTGSPDAYLMLRFVARLLTKLHLCGVDDALEGTTTLTRSQASCHVRGPT